MCVCVRKMYNGYELFLLAVHLKEVEECGQHALRVELWGADIRSIDDAIHRNCTHYNVSNTLRCCVYCVCVCVRVCTIGGLGLVRQR